MPRHEDAYFGIELLYRRYPRLFDLDTLEALVAIMGTRSCGMMNKNELEEFLNDIR